MKFGPKLNESISRIIKAKLCEDRELLEYLRIKLCQSGNVTVILYDIQCTDHYDPNTDGSNYPQALQYSFYNPLSGKHISSYLKATTPISREIARETGVYNSSRVKFSLLSSIPCDGHDLGYLLNQNCTQYWNLALLDRIYSADLISGVENVDELIPKLEAKIEKYISRKCSTKKPIISLDDIDAPYFYQKMPEILEFLDINNDVNSITIFMSHQGSKLSEHVFKAEIKSSCNDFSHTLLSNPDKYIFLDSDVLISTLFKNTPIACGPNKEKFDSMFGSTRTNLNNTVQNVKSLWVDIEYVVNTAYFRTDYAFILSKIIETLTLLKYGG